MHDFGSCTQRVDEIAARLASANLRERDAQDRATRAGETRRSHRMKDAEPEPIKPPAPRVVRMTPEELRAHQRELDEWMPPRGGVRGGLMLSGYSK